MIRMKGGSIYHVKEIYICQCTVTVQDKRAELAEPMDYKMRFVVDSKSYEDARSYARDIIKELGFYECGIRDLSIMERQVDTEKM